MEGPWEFVPTVPFCVVLGAAIHKPRQPGKFRTIWNVSVPGPHLAKIGVDNGNFLVFPVASNAAAALPSYTAMACLSIERVCLSLHILAGVAVAAGETLQGISRDFAHWFKMFYMSRTEQRKGCVAFGNKMYIYVRAQMGRVVGAHLGQHTSFLISSIAMQRAALDFRHCVHNGEVPAPITLWAAIRPKTSTVEQTLPIIFLVFQDDMLELVVGDQAQNILANIENSLIREELGVEFSTKPKANRTFETTFEFIGAEFDTSDASNV